jgi:fatty acyl-CoA reductase
LTILSTQLFDLLKSTKNIHEIIDNIKIIEGDCSQENLGISTENRKVLTENVTLIYHFAATTRFDEPLKSAVELNVRGTSELLKIASECKNLQLFCHISTAYCHLDEKHLHEVSYPSPYNPHEIIKIASNLDDQAETKKFLSATIPNTYVLTKALAETLVDEAHKNKLPVMILRPSIVTPTLHEPVAGWMNSYNGLGGLMIAVGKGVLRDIHCNQKYHGDFIPVDVAIHVLMMCTWNYLSNG